MNENFEIVGDNVFYFQKTSENWCNRYFEIKSLLDCVPLFIIRFFVWRKKIIKKINAYWL